MLLSPLTLSASAFASGTAKIPQPDTVSPGFAGFAAIFLLTCATILLMRSMTKHLRKVRYSPDPAAPEGVAQARPISSAAGGAGRPAPPIPSAENRPKSS